MNELISHLPVTIMTKLDKVVQVLMEVWNGVLPVVALTPSLTCQRQELSHPMYTTKKDHRVWHLLERVNHIRLTFICQFCRLLRLHRFQRLGKRPMEGTTEIIIITGLVITIIILLILIFLAHTLRTAPVSGVVNPRKEKAQQVVLPRSYDLGKITLVMMKTCALILE